MALIQPSHSLYTRAAVDIGEMELESGARLEHVEMSFERVGPASAPVILICHALTGNQMAAGTEQSPGWWSGMIGKGLPIDTDHYQVITFNVLGGCHGSTGPASLHPTTKKKYRCDFPAITIRDMVHAQYKALNQLGVHSLHAVIGGSLGGMQALEWGLLHPDFMKQIHVLAATPYLSDYGIAFNHIGAQSIKNDPLFDNGNYLSNESLKGFEIARMAGMVTYRSSKLFDQRFERRKKTSQGFDIQSYLDYQGNKIKTRFDANSYLYLLEAMNHHDIGRGRNGWKEAARNYKAEVYTTSFENDLVYTKPLIESFSSSVPKGFHKHVETDYGHDGFLVEFDKWGNWIQRNLTN
ncbi:homoserine O-acetyltransferase [Halobacillus yeomjeoni]|uniref:Homoserine O-acetyltransferase n=1 Tax=Halobacillus yeomjeoni TaxID=311194 RepID=A0A931MV50_9BACI|nr:homoserine O-acetyltransferase [Halobacillus yeomjeoni]MBH0230457.1 homoserine O-acetyltransferase [Halobacillus yeomjeoni]MCA0985343.1 homoserine O-acetyltransferase [Halobacillus yeomjeoni]